LERSGYATATTALERAARLTGDSCRRATLLVAAAEAAWGAGRAEQALRLLDESRAGDSLEPGVRITAERLAGRIATNRGPVMRGHAMLVAAAEFAVAELGAAADAITMFGDAAIACFLACQTDALTVIARRVEAILPLTSDPGAHIRAATITGVERILSGDAAAGARSLHEALALTETLAFTDTVTLGETTAAVNTATPVAAEPPRLGDLSLLTWIAFGPLFLRESEAGRAQLAAVLGFTRERAAIGELPFVLALCARDQATTSRWRLAEATYREAIALGRESEQRTCLTFALSGLAWLQARQGRERDCRAGAEEAMTLAREMGSRLHELWSLTALGELELAHGHPGEALAYFERQRQVAQANAITDADLWPAAEIVEASLRLGREDDARRTTAAFHLAAAAKGQPWSLARALRCEGLIAAPAAFAACFEAAVEHHRQTPDVFELARTRLVYGERLRRHRQRVLARSQLREAAEIFTALDARPWLERAWAELEATGETLRRGEPNTIGELTPQELQIATMLAAGRTTRETAAALFLSPKTVEYHLHHVYMKLGIHSREELARVDGLGQEAATEKTGGSRVAAVAQLAPASPEAKTSPEVAPK
ncbi:MAG: hypothetical protein KGL16_01790, partial [Acidobacteriota bacterium]|nr:hypothetical protein [Acidobacteriota bacterium]